MANKKLKKRITALEVEVQELKEAKNKPYNPELTFLMALAESRQWKSIPDDILAKILQQAF